MSDFESYISRHGEFGVQAIVERWERFQGIRVGVEVPLETRWAVFMGNDNLPQHHQQRIAA